MQISTIRLNIDDKTWLLFFSVAASLIVMLLYFTETHAFLSYSMSQFEKRKKNELNNRLTLNVNESDEKNPSIEKKTIMFLSNLDTKARGKLTRKKGFQILSKEEKLQFAKRGSMSEKQQSQN